MILTNTKLFQRVAFRRIYLCQDFDRLQSTETLESSVFGLIKAQLFITLFPIIGDSGGLRRVVRV